MDPLVATEPSPPPPLTGPRRLVVPAVLVVLLCVLLGGGQRLFSHAQAQSNRVALTDAPRLVTVVAARASQFRASRRYVGTLEPWLSAQVGPQLVSAYVSEVTVRPGDVVQRGAVLARLDCRMATTAARALTLQARATQARQSALAHQATRLSGLVAGGFVAENELEQRRAESESEEARVLATRAQLAGAALGENDCVLRAPFDGEVSERLLDPGAFVRPGASMLTLVERGTVRVTFEVPESDFSAAAPGTPVQLRLLSDGRTLTSTVTRRAPSAETGTRTIHIEVDLPNPSRTLPVHTTAEVTIDVGAAVPALTLPLTAASVRGTRAAVFVVEGDVAHARSLTMLGERDGQLFVTPQLPAGALLVTEGRALLANNDRVRARVEEPAQ